MKKILMLALCFTLASSTTAIFAAKDGDSHDSHGGGHEHHLSLFNGVTTTINPAGSHYYTIGLDYEKFLFNGAAGIGVLLDVATDFAHDPLIIAAVPLSAHFGHLRIFLAPGFEFAHGHSEFMTRVGLGYDFDLGGIYLTPTVSFDYIYSPGYMSLVYGVAVGVAF